MLSTVSLFISCVIAPTLAKSIMVQPKIYPLCPEGPYPSLFIDSGNHLGLPSNQYVICVLRYYPLVFNCSDGLEFNWSSLSCDYPQNTMKSHSQGPVFYPFPVHTKPYIPPNEVEYHWPTTAKPGIKNLNPNPNPQQPEPAPQEPIDLDQPIHRPYPTEDLRPFRFRPPCLNTIGSIFGHLQPCTLPAEIDEPMQRPYLTEDLRPFRFRPPCLNTIASIFGHLQPCPLPAEIDEPMQRPYPTEQ